MAAFLIPESYSAEKVDLFQKKKHLNPTSGSKPIRLYFYMKGQRYEPYESQSVHELNKSWVISIYIYSSELRRLVMRVNPLTSRRFSELIQKHITYVLELLRVKSRKVIFLYDQRFILWNQYVFAYFYDKRYFNSTQSNILKMI